MNEYLRAIAREKVTAKEFPPWHGTVQMLMELFQSGPALSATDAKRRLCAAVKSTAAKLGNRPATCAATTFIGHAHKERGPWNSPRPDESLNAPQLRVYVTGRP